MKAYQQVEYLRQKYNVPIWQMCNILCIASEAEYNKIITGKHPLTVLQKILIADTFRTPIEDNE